MKRYTTTAGTVALDPIDFGTPVATRLLTIAILSIRERSSTRHYRRKSVNVRVHITSGVGKVDIVLDGTTDKVKGGFGSRSTSAGDGPALVLELNVVGAGIVSNDEIACGGTIGAGANSRSRSRRCRSRCRCRSSGGSRSSCSTTAIPAYGSVVGSAICLIVGPRAIASGWSARNGFRSAAAFPAAGAVVISPTSPITIA